ncbi:MAG TPA: two-component regulator propeller domain-containing protein [Chitinophaga sp.]|uniref:ligand-binding sensor domain-containing protein n=1 Tax=Chitinophaga sp. TaxID=1869181 RepID=UPI002BA255B7|nr:two-component regulator propeller domain-containing protein [Chitinophaga sp.]HVI48229.1 two-component regulator propeller domain-containing protein [Chitinophaga sp.]
MSPIYRNCLLLLLGLGYWLSASPAGSQYPDSLILRRLAMEDGLPDAHITSLAQDTKGFLWIGTFNGLSRYDGTAFKNFFHTRQTNTLPGNQIANIINYDSSHLLIATTTGLTMLDTHSLTFKTLQVSSSPVMFSRDNSFGCLVTDSVHNIWAGTRTTLYYLSPDLKILKTFRGFKEKDYNLYRMNYIGNVQLLPGNEVLIWSENEKTGAHEYFIYYSLSGSLQPLTQLPHHPLYPLSLMVTGYCSIDKQGNVRFIKQGTDSLGMLDMSTGKLHYTRIALSNGMMHTNTVDNRVVSAGYETYACIFNIEGMALLPAAIAAGSTGKLMLTGYLTDRVVTAIMKDNTGNIWIGSNNGLYKAVNRSGNVQSVFIKRPKHTPWNLWNVSFINDAVWVSSEPYGYLIFDRQLRLRDNILLKGDPLLNTALSVLTTTSNDTLWLNTQVGARWYNTRTKQAGLLHIKSKPAAMDNWIITTVYKDSKALTWMGIGFGNGVVQYNPATRSFIHYPAKEGENRLPIRYPFAIAEDNESNLWMGNHDGAALVCWKRKTNRFSTILPDYYAVFDNARINTLLCNRKKLLWIGTADGLFCYDIPGRRFTKYDMTQGLPSNVISSMAEDNKGRLWIGTNNGLSCFSLSSKKYTNFLYPVVLPEAKINNVEYDSLSGRIFFTTDHYVNTFDPDSLLNSTVPLSISITGISIGNREKALQPVYNIPYYQNDISISYTAVNFADGPLNRYYYRLNDEEWISVGAQRQINFHNLPAGSYSFALKAMSNAGVWSNEAMVTFIISPPWWRQLWLQVIVVLALAAMIIFLVRRRIRHIRFMVDMKQKIVETEMKALRAQMNPHFIFNCMNSIDGLIQSNDRYHATVYLNKFAKLLRNVLDSSKQNTVLLEKDLETLQLYIDLELLRSDNNFTVAINTDDSLWMDDYKVPPLIVQPYVENAIVHGIRSRRDNEGRLEITVTRQEEYIEYIIKDNGMGFNIVKNKIPHHGQSYGMQISSDRVKFFNQEEHASVTVTNLEQNGLTVGTSVQVLLKIQP